MRLALRLLRRHRRVDARDRPAHRRASFTALGWVPLPDPNIRAEMVDFGIDYTFWLNIVFGALAAYYVYVNLRNPMHHHGAGHDHAAHERHRRLAAARLSIGETMTMTISPFLTALGSEGPPADRAKDMDLYGWLIGSWEMDSVRYLDDGTIQKCNGECHFGWVLEGRAIQDVWIRPKRPAPSTMYGTTLRIFDPGIGGWHIIWNDPLNQDHSRQIGRAEGKDIVQLGNDSRGLKTRWRFTEITANSFHWIGEERSSESDPWQITYEHLARRTNC